MAQQPAVRRPCLRWRPRGHREYARALDCCILAMFRYVTSARFICVLTLSGQSVSDGIYLRINVFGDACSYGVSNLTSSAAARMSVMRPTFAPA
jgi:hypothetical protein